VIDESRLGGLPRWGFATPGALRDDLTRRALAGVKTATAALVAEYEIEDEALPVPGARQVLVDSAERPVAIVETTSVRVVPLADVDDSHAIDEGEGYPDAAAFREAHERYWHGELDVIRAGLGDPAFTLTDDTPVVAERFLVAEVLGPDAGPRTSVRPAMPADRPAVDAFLAAREAALVARRDELVDARLHPALIAEADGALAGVATWIAADGQLELLTLHVAEQWSGAGSALIAAARTVTRAIGARRLWLITTNDNLDALRFYQRRGLRLVKVDPGAVDRSRATCKPSIPAVGAFGIPIRDELELELVVDATADTDPGAPG
jgi:uncharacterized protein YhfF/N-acetylglutamate synthase-like GNAT family acetyltransferase